MSQNGKGDRDRRQGQDFKKWDESKLWDDDVKTTKATLTMTCPSCGHTHSEIIPKEMKR